MWPKSLGAPPAITQRTLMTLIDGEDTLTERQRVEIERLTAEYRFFHWHLEFPHIFPTESTAGDTVNDATGWYGGFSVVIGNPPWERVKLQEQEFFASRDPDIAKAPNAAARKRLIAALPATNPALHDAFVAEKRSAEGVSHFMRNSGRYPLAGRGDINTYAVFAETDRELLGGTGRLGVILPTGIATDATTQYFFKDLVEHGAIASLYDFENRKPLFEAVDSRFKFCLLTLTGRDLREPTADFAFFAHDPTDLERTGVRFGLTPEEILRVNPNTGTSPVCRSRRDAEIMLAVHSRVPVMMLEGDPDGNPWGAKFKTMFHMSNDSHLFHTSDELQADGWTLRGNVFHRGEQEMLPLYQGMMASLYNHRAADVVHSATAAKRQNQPRYLSKDELADPHRLAMPAFWVGAENLPDGVGSWFVAYSWVTSPTNERTMVSYPLPKAAVGNSTPLILVNEGALMLATLSSFALDYVLRQKLGGLNLTFTYVQQLPVLQPVLFEEPTPWCAGTTLRSWIVPRVGELVYTATDMSGFATEYGLGSTPFSWDSVRREGLVAELDAAFFHLYGVERDDVDYIMETFPIVKRKDIAAHGEYRTKRLILEIYDAMAEAEATGIPYASQFDKAGK